MKKYIIIAWILSLYSMSGYAARNASKDGEWMDIGRPTSIHQNVEQNSFYFEGTNHGSCAGVKPTYIRVNMDAPHFDKFYSLLLFLNAKNNASLSCEVKSRCGSTQVWVEECRVVGL